MATSSVYNLNGEKTSDYDLNDDIFNIVVNTNCIYEAVMAHLRNRRVSVAAVKNRSEIKGSGRKPWRQKGTGRARAGTRKSPIWVGGGVTFGPQPRDFKYKLTKKKKRKAIKSALSDKLKNDNLILLEEGSLEEPKTKVIKKFLDKMKFDNKKVLFIISSKDETLRKSIRNIKKAYVINSDNINTYDIVNSNQLIIQKDLISRIEENLK